MDIRLAEESDLPQAASLWHDRAAVLQQSDGFSLLAPDCQTQWQALASQWLRDEDCAVFVAETRMTIVGYMIISLCEGAPGTQPKQLGKVVEMAVDLHHAHRGLAGKLLDRAQAWLKARQIDTMAIDVPVNYAVEEAFWRAQGAGKRFNQFWLKL